MVAQGQGQKQFFEHKGVIAILILLLEQQLCICVVKRWVEVDLIRQVV